MPVNYDELNHSELVSLANFNDVRGASRAVPREDLIRAIETHTDLPQTTVLHTIREEFAAWVKAHWDTQLRMQIKEPGISDKGVTCSDLQLLNYYMANEEDIQLWRATKRHA
jgi:hypothetical protein